MKFTDWLNEKEDELLKKSFGDILSSPYKNAQPFKSSNNLIGTFSVLVFNLLKEIKNKNKKIESISVQDKGKFDFIIYIDKKSVFDNSIAMKIESPKKYSTGPSISGIAGVIKSEMPFIDFGDTKPDMEYAKAYKKVK